MDRIVGKEILDELNPEDPRAIRSRQDLRVVNLLMGNERWIQRTLGSELVKESHVAELGAGNGELCEELSEAGWQVTGFDLLPKPESSAIQWRSGDFMETLVDWQGQAVVGSLILHHFQDEQLQQLGEILQQARLLVFAEPLRNRWAEMQGYGLYPWVNDVTRFDMMASIRAGFCAGELPCVLGLKDGWHWEEKATLRGGLRCVGRKIS